MEWLYEQITQEEINMIKLEELWHLIKILKFNKY